MTGDNEPPARERGPTGPFLREYVPKARFFPQTGTERPSVASVVFYRNGGHSVVTAFGTQHVGKRFWDRPQTVCEIALGTFATPLQMELPGAEAAFFFQADVDIVWAVTDPHLAALVAVTDVAERLAVPIWERLREVTSRYGAREAEQAERAIAVGGWGDLGAALGMEVRLYVRLQVGDRLIDRTDGAWEARFSADRAKRRRALSPLRPLKSKEVAFLRQMGASPYDVERIRRVIDVERIRRVINLARSGQIQLEDVAALVRAFLDQDSPGEEVWALRRSAPPRQEEPQGSEARAEEDLETDEPPIGSGDEPDTLPALGRILRDSPPTWASVPPPTPPLLAGAESGSAEPRRLVAELAEQTSPGRSVPLHVQIVREDELHEGVQLRPFFVPPEGARVLITIHAPGLVAIDELQQELHVMPGRNSDVLRFRLKAPTPGLHKATVRAFRGGTFLGEVTCQISVEHDSPTRDGPQRQAPLPSMAFDPGEITLQVLKDEAAGTFSFQLISETFYAPEVFQFRAGNPRQATEQIYAELRRAAKAAATTGGGGDASRLRDRLRNHGVQLWTSAVPQAVQSQFWNEADNMAAFTVLGEHDIVPWELLYPLNEEGEDRGFLAEWLPVVRRVFGQDRVRSLSLPGVAFVVPPGSPAEAGQEVTSLRARLGAQVADVGVLSERAALTALIEGGHAGLLHFACHNSFTGTGSCVTMADGPFDPIDLASAAQLRTLRPHRPLVFFNACRSAGEIDWFGESLGWAPQFLNAGAGAFIGTLWPVRSRSALQFAETFYDQLLTHRRPLGQASLAARQTIRDLHGGDPTWLAYAVYGSPAATAHTTA
ncbi:CHAT domain-containing protein [Streptomyces sp. NPDC047070]|uniref:CHAT domain-containing protein n=1 Tax=Streptomyces sp. NPDC047070 TaxID=3154923 RepID=UPI00345455E5